MKTLITMSHSERRELLETRLSNAEYMAKLETEISTARGWSAQRKQAARLAIPKWEKRITELKTLLKGT